MREHLREILRVAGTLVFAGIVVGLIGFARQFGCSRAPEGYKSMQPAVQEGESFMIKRNAQTLEALPAGTVIVYRTEGTSGTNMIGRVVALPGQIVSTRGTNFVVDGKTLKTPANATAIGRVDGLIVPQDCVLVGFDAGGHASLQSCIVPMHNVIGKTRQQR